MLKLNDQKLEVSNTQKKLDILKDSLDEIEDMIGLGDQSKEISDMQTRIENVRLSTLHKNILLHDVPSGNPLPGKAVVTSKWGFRIHPINKKKQFHKGIDMRARLNTKVRSTADGIVALAYKDKGYGYLIVVQHNYGFKTYYAHLNKLLVKNGRYVAKNQVIGLSGNTGISSGPHLHYEIRFLNKSLNPFNFVRWKISTFDSIFKKETRVPWAYLIQAVTVKLKQIRQQSSHKVPLLKEN